MHGLTSLIEIDTKWDCLNSGGIWISTFSTFDNVLLAIRTLFQMATTVGWADVMYMGMSLRGVNKTHSPKANSSMAFLFIIIIIVCSFFVLNLFVGIVINAFNREKERLGRSFLLTREQKEWLDIKLLLF